MSITVDGKDGTVFIHVSVETAFFQRAAPQYVYFMWAGSKQAETCGQTFFQFQVKSSRYVSSIGLTVFYGGLALTQLSTVA